MREKFKNSRQKAQSNSGSINKLFNALVLNFCYNPKGCCQFLHITAEKSLKLQPVAPADFSLFSTKIGLAANLLILLV